MAPPAAVDTADATVILMPHRAANWVEARTLLVADLHLGKAESIRAAGAPLSEKVLAGVMDKDLERLAAAVRTAGATRVVILGDLLHAASGITPAMTKRFVQWRAALEQAQGVIELCIVPGNHDRALARVRVQWGLVELGATHGEGPFVFTHEPPERGAGDRYTWCGHVHPAVRVGSRSNSITLPCFHVGTRVGILPAFGEFTAGGPCAPGTADFVFAIADTLVIKV